MILAVFCRIQNVLERKKANIKIKNSSDSSASNKLLLIKKSYRFMNSYLYGWMRYQIIMVGKIPSYRARNFLYRSVFNMKISKKTVIYGECEIRTPWKIEIGNSIIGKGCVLDGRNGIIIKDNVTFGSFVHVWTEEHDVNDEYFGVSEQNRRPVIVENHAWVASDSTLLPGVIVHTGAVVASRACVTKNCDEYTINAGVPAKKIGNRNNNLKYEFSGKPHWHFY